ncbi:chalcone isomerase family protein [Parathalassolituus penaei]|uniref:Chalcone isomerase family protein n=1 Tax=Parathalassolituus penaei TaxID=2997323 RepID=A0A9X3EFB2_9GAMM|nr:chalcone isomerase family protein [Parathalassolituus penaei]MCY0965704.1 chalcone isomerase family protein [Parathalassolituus penaei]
MKQLTRIKAKLGAGLLWALCSTVYAAPPAWLSADAANEPPQLLVQAQLRELNYLPEAYVAMFYRQAAASPGSDSSQTIQLQVVSERISGRVLAMNLFDSVGILVPEEEFLALENRLNAMVRMLDGKLERGDAIEIRYHPDRGSEITVRGEFKGMLAGKDLFDAVSQVAMVNPLASLMESADNGSVAPVGSPAPADTPTSI